MKTIIKKTSVDNIDMDTINQAGIIRQEHASHKVGRCALALLSSDSCSACPSETAFEGMSKE